MKKRSQLPGFLTGLLTMALVMSLAVPALAAYTKNMTVSYSDIKINVNGAVFTPKDVNGRVVEPFIYEGTTYLPVRAVANAVGYNVAWDQASQTVFLTNGGGNNGGSVPSGGGATTAPATKLVDTMEPYASYEGTWYYDSYPSTGSQSLTLGGTAYKNAISLDGGFHYNENYVSYNLGGTYRTLGGIIGTVDGEDDKRPTTITIYGDGNVLKTFDLASGDLPVTFSVNVTGVSALKFATNGYSDIGFANLELS